MKAFSLSLSDDCSVCCCWFGQFRCLISGTTFGFCTLVPSAGCFCSLQSVAAALQAEQDPEAHWPWQD